MTEIESNNEDEGEEGLSLVQRVAIVMLALGEETSGEVMKYLTDREVEEITEALATLKNVSADVMDQVLEEFEAGLMAGNWVSQGGVDFARQALERAVGPRKAQEILDRISSTVTSGFYILRNVPADQIAPFISHEHPQSIALILSQLDADQASGILAQLPERLQPDVAYRIATMENIAPNVLKEMEMSLEETLKDMLGGNQDAGGPKVVADMLNLTGSSVEKNVLDNMENMDPNTAESVRNLMFVFEDILKLSDREIQILLREVDQKDLVIALKSSSEELKEKVLGNMSDRVRQFVTEEMDFTGPMRLSEVEEVQLRIVQMVRQLEEQGQITILSGDADDQFV
jgi:flagellar motor switch protein FliG|tara:strand:- start:378 stop:1409 length:1032 start_codon:yes stop_codon:yes gene_type:complete